MRGGRVLVADAASWWRARAAGRTVCGARMDRHDKRQVAVGGEELCAQRRA